jgi:MFS family permease
MATKNESNAFANASVVQDDHESGASGTHIEANLQPPAFNTDFRFWAILVGLSVTNILGALENLILVTAAPVILRDLDIGEDFIWITNSFFVCSAAFQPLIGQLCNVFGRRWPTLSIVVIFMLGSGICGGATSGGMLIAGRAVQGIGSGGIIMVIDIIISDLVPLRQRNNYMAVVLGVYGIGTAIAPVIGGEIVATTTWRWIFYLNLPIGGAALAILFVFLHVDYNKEMTLQAKLRQIDLIGNGFLIAGTVAILYSLSYAGTIHPWSSWNTLVPLLLGFLSFLIFAFCEVFEIAQEPVMPKRLFQHRTSVIVAVNTFLYSVVLFWILFFLPVYFQSVKLYSSTYSGVALLPQSIVGIPGAMLGGMAVSRWGRYKPVHLLGFAILTLGTGIFSLQDRDTTTAEWATFQSVGALGRGMVLVTLLPAFQAPVSEKDQAAATAAWCFIRTMGYTWGVAIPAAIFNNRVQGLLHQISDESVRAIFSRGDAYQFATADFIRQFPTVVQDQIINIYTLALERLFHIGIAFAGLAFVLALFELEVPLRTELETEFGLVSERRENEQS